MEIAKKLISLSVILSSVVLLQTPAIAKTGFKDLTEDHKFYDALIFLQERGVFNGYKDGSVKADDSIKRGEILKVIIEGDKNHSPDENLHKNCFPDVDDQWFAKYVCYAKEQGWVEGYEDNLFHPGRKINRVEANKIILNAYFKDQGLIFGDDNFTFTDTPKDQWFFKFASTSKRLNILPEQGTEFLPGNIRTRGEVAEIIARAILVKENQNKKYAGQLKNTPTNKSPEKEETKETKETVQTETTEEVEKKIFDLINQLRAEDGKQPLIIDENLSKVAREHSKDMAENLKELSHDGSNGSTPNQRISKSGFKPIMATAENVGWGTFAKNVRGVYETTEYVHLEIFMKEPDGEVNHKTNLLSRIYPFTHVGVGVYVKDNNVYFTTDFAAKEL